MNRVRVDFACLTVIIVSSIVVLTAQQRGQAPPPLVKENGTVKVSDHAYLIPDDNVPVVPNVGIIVGSKATVVVDTGLGPRNGETVLREVAKVSKNSDLYLVTTHFHPEHAAGSSAFPPTAKFIVSKSQQRELDELGLDMNRRFASFSPITAELLKDVQFRRPDVVFERDHNLDLGGLRVRIFSRGPMHTRGDTMVFVEGDRVLFAGDVVMNRAFLAWGQDGSARVWTAALKELDALGARTVVPSHGRMGDGTIVGQQLGVVEGLQARVRELKGQGRPADEAAQTLVSEFQAKYPDWTGPNRVGAAVRAMYAEGR